MKRLIATYFNKNGAKLTGDYTCYYPKDSIAVLPQKQTVEVIKSRSAKVFYLDDQFDRFTVEASCLKAFVHLSQGIGDIIAFSAVTDYLADTRPDLQIIIYAYPQFHTVLHRFYKTDNLIIKDFHSAICDKFTFQNRITRFKNLQRIYIEYAANEAGSQNWYDAYFRRIGMKEAPSGYRRPFLFDTSAFQSDRIENNSILINHRSSCQARSSAFEDFYIPTKRVFPNRPILVHEQNLTDADKAYIDTVAKDVVVLQKQSLSHYLDELSYAYLVISTDSAAIHYREGIQKPAVGIYGAFTTDSRTSGYKFTTSFDTDKVCAHQPCFVHQDSIGEVCQAISELISNDDEHLCSMKLNRNIAPCQSGEWFQEQLFQHLRQLAI